jgi:hypothetical protein
MVFHYTRPAFTDSPLNPTNQQPPGIILKRY